MSSVLGVPSDVTLEVPEHGRPLDDLASLDSRTLGQLRPGGQDTGGLQGRLVMGCWWSYDGALMEIWITPDVLFRGTGGSFRGGLLADCKGTSSSCFLSDLATVLHFMYNK